MSLGSIVYGGYEFEEDELDFDMESEIDLENNPESCGDVTNLSIGNLDDIYVGDIVEDILSQGGKISDSLNIRGRSTYGFWRK